MNINQSQNEIVAEFEVFDQWMDKYEYIIELGRQLPPLDAKYKTAQHLIRGCQSQVWLHAELNAGKVAFAADSDAVITKGIIALLIRVLNGQTAAAVAGADLFFIDKIGLKEHLSPTRSNGLLNMVGQMKAIGEQFARAN